MARYSFVLLVSAACASITPSASAQEKKADSEWVSLFNGRNLEGWTAKFAGHESGENYLDTFRVEDGVIKASYDKYKQFDGKFGHLFYKDKFSHYDLRLEYRFLGEQSKGAPGWALRNSGVMFHSQSPQSMRKEQDFPVSIEFQFLGGVTKEDRPTGSMCSPGTNVVINNKLITQHCVNSKSKTFHGDQWVTAELQVRGSGNVKHLINGEVVMEYEQPQLDPKDKDGAALIKAASGKLLLEEGYIALQAESHPCEFRKIEVRVLKKPAEPKDGLRGAVGKPQPMILVEASYPGASAQVVAETVAAPIEQQVNGVEGSIRLESRSNNDGNYVLAVTFKPGTDLGKAQLLVQNRVALAQPVLPDLVKRLGVTVRKKSPLRMIVSLTSPGGKHDTVYLSNYASIQVKDELARVAGVGEVTHLGQRDYSMRVWLDPEKLAARNLSPADVVEALRQQNRHVPAGRVGQPPVPKGQDFQFKLETKGRLSDPKEFEDIVIKTDGKGVKILLKDVGSIKQGAAQQDDFVSLNGKPGVLLCIYPTGTENAKDLSRDVVDKIAKLRARAPEGLQLEVAFDFTANLEAPGGPKTAEYLLLDLEFPDGASIDRKRETLTRCEKILRDVAGVTDVLSLTETPFDIIQRPSGILVRLARAEKRKATREEMMRKIRKELDAIRDAHVRLRDLSRLGGYAIDLAVSGPDQDKVRELAQKLAERLQESKKLTDIWASRESAPRPSLYVDIHRDKAATMGVALNDIFDTLQVYLGSAYVNDFNRFGRTWQVVVQADEKFRRVDADLKQLKIRNKQGELVALESVATVRSINAPAVIHRLDLWPTVQVTANLATAVSEAQARKICEIQFEQLRKESRLPAEYRLTWLREISTPK